MRLMAMLDFTIMGRRFERLIAIGPAFLMRAGARRHRFVVVQCDCGTRLAVRADNIEGVESCGCKQKDVARELGQRRSGEKAPGYKHGGKGTRLYSVWVGMLRRCSDSGATGYHNYGGRGISVCDEWRAFGSFRDWANRHGYKPGLEIDRRDNNGNYEPGNCRFVTVKANARNRRDNVLLTAFGEIKCVSAWADDPRAQADCWTIRGRLLLGWDHERALVQPKRRLRRRI